MPHWKFQRSIDVYNDVEMTVRACRNECTCLFVQLKCVGGTAGCSAFVPQIVQCYNRGSDGTDIQVYLM